MLLLIGIVLAIVGVLILVGVLGAATWVGILFIVIGVIMIAYDRRGSLRL